MRTRHEENRQSCCRIRRWPTNMKGTSNMERSAGLRVSQFSDCRFRARTGRGAGGWYGHESRNPIVRHSRPRHIAAPIRHGVSARPVQSRTQRPNATHPARCEAQPAAERPSPATMEAPDTSSGTTDDDAKHGGAGLTLKRTTAPLDTGSQRVQGWSVNCNSRAAMRERQGKTIGRI